MCYTKQYNNMYTTTNNFAEKVIKFSVDSSYKSYFVAIQHFYKYQWDLQTLANRPVYCLTSFGVQQTAHSDNQPRPHTSLNVT